MPTTTLRPKLAFMLAAAVLTTAAIVIRAQGAAAPDVPYPRDFRGWHHVKSIVIGPEHPSFANRGGIHHYYANDRAMEGYRTGTFPAGSVIVDEAVFTKDGEGQGKGITFEGDRRALDVMVKNNSLYKDTRGWGFEHFDRDSTAGTLPAAARAKCFECHTKATHDLVYSTVRK